MGVTVATTRVAANTSTGTQDITTVDLGGLTPVAAMFIWSLATTDGTPATHNVVGIGAATGAANRWARNNESEDAQATTDASGILVSTHCIYIRNGNGILDGSADFDSFISNGVRINWDDAPSSAWLMTVVLFAGTDVSAHAEAIALNTGISPLDITSIGFEADLVIGTSIDRTLNNNVNNYKYSTGFCHNGVGITQGCINVYDATNVATTSVGANVFNDRFLSPPRFFGDTVSSVTLSAFDADGFTATISGGDATCDMGILALAFNSVVDVWVGSVQSPTSTGNQGITSPGFTPQFVIQMTTFVEAIGTAEVDADGGTAGISVFDVDDEYSVSGQSEDAVSGSNTQNVSDNTAIELPAHDGSAGLTASFVSFDANGWTLNYSAVEANAKLFWALAIEEEATGQTVSANTITLASSPQQSTLSPGAVSSLLDTLSLLGDIQALSVSPGAVSSVMDELTLVSSIEALVISPGAVNLLLDTLSINGSPQTIVIVPGAVIVSPNTLTLSSSLQQVTIFVSVAVLLDTLLLDSSVQSLTVSPGTISSLLDTLILNSSAENLSIIAGAISTILNTLSLSLSIENLTISVGGVSIPLDELLLSGSLQNLTVSPGAVSVPLDTLTLSGSVEDITIAILGLIVSLSTLSLQSSAQSLSISSGDVLTLLDTLTLVSSLQDIQIGIIVSSIPGKITLSVELIGDVLDNITEIGKTTKDISSIGSIEDDVRQ